MKRCYGCMQPIENEKLHTCKFLDLMPENIVTASKSDIIEFLNSVIDEGDGKFTIVMDVKMPDSDEPVNINLPVEKNEDGKFVFTDYPYWDKSE